MRVSLFMVARALLAAAMLTVVGPTHAQQAYATPEAAAEALGDAVARSDTDALRRVLGPRYQLLLPPEGITQDDIYDFLAAWHAHHTVEPVTDSVTSVAVGDSGWTFPAPLVRQATGWRFDIDAGRREVRNRRIGRNELVAMDTLLQLSDAQQRYAGQMGEGRYAKRIVSTRGRTDGLYWPADREADASPLGADALMMGPDTPPAEAYYGYRFRVLPPGAGTGARFAFVAWPARYGDTGVKTFLIDSDRNFYERDLGPSTASRAAALRYFSPEGWQRVADR